MSAHRFASCLLPLLVVLAAPRLAADETPPNQLVVFGGVSILDASAESSSVLPIGAGFRIPGREGRFGPGRFRPDFGRLGPFLGCFRFGFSPDQFGLGLGFGFNLHGPT